MIFRLTAEALVHAYNDPSPIHLAKAFIKKKIRERKGTS